jgi:hypothetical protein
VEIREEIVEHGQGDGGPVGSATLPSSTSPSSSLPPSSTGAGAAPSSPVTPSRGPSTRPHAPSGEIDTAV